MNNDDFKENKDQEMFKLVGDCIAYTSTCSYPWFNIPVQYKISYQPNEYEREMRQPEDRTRPLEGDDVVLLISPGASQENVLNTLRNFSNVINQAGLYLGESLTQDPEDPRRLFDKGGHITGKLDSLA